MKIRNRRTGQIVDTIQPLLGGAGMTIAELNEEWEDYEEPKGIERIKWLNEEKKRPLNLSVNTATTFFAELAV